MVYQRFVRSLLILSLFMAAVIFIAATGFSQTIPHLSRQGDATQLIVDDEPFLILGGELGNSSASSLVYMEDIWPRLVRMNLNTVLVPVYWDLMEPQEGQFDFSLVDGMIKQAREQELRLILLWFGTWKNSMSCYVPEWVKIDQKRFPRARTRSGQALEIVSAFSDASLQADINAFEALMRHLRDVDGKKHTVIMIQVENEIGMLEDARDYLSVRCPATASARDASQSGISDGSGWTFQILAV